jgi:hypothetical protein
MRYRTGHAPGDIRDTFRNAVYESMDRDGHGPEPTIELEIQPRPITISKAHGLVWHCTDIIPGNVFRWLQEELESAELEPKRLTYAACVHGLSLVKYSAA